MPRVKASFKNTQGECLSGLLEIPDTETKAYCSLFYLLERYCCGIENHKGISK